MFWQVAESRRLRSLAFAAAIVAVAIITVRLAVTPSADLLNHREFGRRFVAGSYLYEGGLNYPYPMRWPIRH